MPLPPHLCPPDFPPAPPPQFHYPSFWDVNTFTSAKPDESCLSLSGVSPFPSSPSALPLLSSVPCLCHCPCPPPHPCPYLYPYLYPHPTPTLSLLKPPQVTSVWVQEQQQKRDRAQQIAEHRRGANAVDRCSLCCSSASRPRHLTISLGQTAYLALPAR